MQLSNRYTSRDVARALAIVLVRRALGGAGSGNYGHAGRPGEVGGSSDSSWTNPSPKTASQIFGRTPGAPLKTYKAYHVTTKVNADSILKNGFDINQVNPRWQNDFAISLSRGEKAATEYFSKRDPQTGKPVGMDTSKYVLLEVSLKGRLFKGGKFETGPVSYAANPRDWTHQFVSMGYDGQDLDRTIYVHNPKAITSIRVVEPKSRSLGGAGSGNYGHSGRPGEIGGSGPSAGLLDAIKKADGGFTYNAVTGEQPKTGYALSLHKDREQVLDAKQVSLVTLAQYAQDNRSLLGQPNNFLGAWHNPVDDKIYIDVSTVVKSATEAERLAREAHQLAYFDLEHGKSIEVPHVKAAAQFGWSQKRPSNATGSYRARQGVDWTRTDTRGNSASEAHLHGEIEKVFEQKVLPLLKRTLAEWHEEDHPRDEKGQFTDSGGGVATEPTKTGTVSPSARTSTHKKFDSVITKAGFKATAYNQLPDDMKKAMNVEPPNPLTQNQLDGISDALSTISQESPGLTEVMKNSVPLVVANTSQMMGSSKVLPAATTIIGPNGHFLVVNSAQAFKNDRPSWSVANRLTVGKTGADRERALYKGVVVHEIGHVADNVRGGIFTRSVMTEITLNSGGNLERASKQLENIRKNFSEYGVTDPGELAAELFAAVVLHQPTPPELRQTVDMMKKAIPQPYGKTPASRRS